MITPPSVPSEQPGGPAELILLVQLNVKIADQWHVSRSAAPFSFSVAEPANARCTCSGVKRESTDSPRHAETNADIARAQWRGLIAVRQRKWISECEAVTGRVCQIVRRQADVERLPTKIGKQTENPEIPLTQIEQIPGTQHRSSDIVRSHAQLRGDFSLIPFVAQPAMQREWRCFGQPAVVSL
jgi:hypothetical protein